MRDARVRQASSKRRHAADLIRQFTQCVVLFVLGQPQRGCTKGFGVVG